MTFSFKFHCSKKKKKSNPIWWQHYVLRKSPINWEHNLQLQYEPIFNRVLILSWSGGGGGVGGARRGLYRWAGAVFQMVTKTEICAHSPWFLITSSRAAKIGKVPNEATITLLNRFSLLGH